MSVKVFQPPEIGPGRAVIEVTPERGLDPTLLEFALETRQGRYLQTDDRVGSGWGSTPCWHRPVEATTSPTGIRFVVDTRITWALTASVTYQLKLQNHDGSAPVMERVAWPAIQMPASSALAVDDTLAASPDVPIAVIAPIPAPPPELPPPLIQPLRAPPEGIFEHAPPTVSVPKKQGVPWFQLAMIVGVLLLIGAGTVGVLWILHNQPPAVPLAQIPVQAPAVPGATGVEPARHFVQSNSDAARLKAEGDRYLAAGNRDAVQGALLLYTAAWDRGEPGGAVEVGKMWDPEGFNTNHSAFTKADADKAMLWYRRAADRNDPEGLFRLGHLLVSGQTSLPNAKEAGISALKRAADLGNEAARTELAHLKEAS
jgi:hypothetical protein